MRTPSLLERADHLRHYREHYTVIFGEQAAARLFLMPGAVLPPSAPVQAVPAATPQRWHATARLRHPAAAPEAGGPLQQPGAGVLPATGWTSAGAAPALLPGAAHAAPQPAYAPPVYPASPQAAEATPVAPALPGRPQMAVPGAPADLAAFMPPAALETPPTPEGGWRSPPLPPLSDRQVVAWPPGPAEVVGPADQAPAGAPQAWLAPPAPAGSSGTTAPLPQAAWPTGPTATDAQSATTAWASVGRASAEWVGAEQVESVGDPPLPRQTDPSLGTPRVAPVTPERTGQLSFRELLAFVHPDEAAPPAAPQPEATGARLAGPGPEAPAGSPQAGPVAPPAVAAWAPAQAWSSAVAEQAAAPLAPGPTPPPHTVQPTEWAAPPVQAAPMPALSPEPLRFEQPGTVAAEVGQERLSALLGQSAQPDVPTVPAAAPVWAPQPVAPAMPPEVERPTIPPAATPQTAPGQAYAATPSAPPIGFESLQAAPAADGQPVAQSPVVQAPTAQARSLTDSPVQSVPPSLVQPQSAGAPPVQPAAVTAPNRGGPAEAAPSAAPLAEAGSASPSIPPAALNVEASAPVAPAAPLARAEPAALPAKPAGPPIFPTAADPGRQVTGLPLWGDSSVIQPELTASVEQPTLHDIGPGVIPAQDAETLRKLASHLPPQAGVQLSLPRRPRPVPLAAPKVEAAEPEAPIHSAAQAQGYLERLNRMMQREADGSSEARPLSLAELLTWNNDKVNDQPPPSDPAAPVAPAAGPAASGGAAPTPPAAPAQDWPPQAPPPTQAGHGGLAGARPVDPAQAAPAQPVAPQPSQTPVDSSDAAPPSLPLSAGQPVEGQPGAPVGSPDAGPVDDPGGGAPGLNGTGQHPAGRPSIGPAASSAEAAPGQPVAGVSAPLNGPQHEGPATGPAAPFMNLAPDRSPAVPPSGSPATALDSAAGPAGVAGGSSSGVAPRQGLPPLAPPVGAVERSTAPTAGPAASQPGVAVPGLPKLPPAGSAPSVAPEQTFTSGAEQPGIPAGQGRPEAPPAEAPPHSEIPDIAQVRAHRAPEGGLITPRLSNPAAAPAAAEPLGDDAALLLGRAMAPLAAGPGADRDAVDAGAREMVSDEAAPMAEDAPAHPTAAQPAAASPEPISESVGLQPGEEQPAAQRAAALPTAGAQAQAQPFPTDAVPAAGPQVAPPAAPGVIPAQDAETLRKLASHLPPQAGVQLSLPRRPRPVPLAAPKVEAAEPEAPIHSAAQAQGYLERLNRMMQREADGSSEARPLSLAELLTWNNDKVNDQPPPSDPAPVPPGQWPLAGLPGPAQGSLDAAPNAVSTGLADLTGTLPNPADAAPGASPNAEVPAGQAPADLARPTVAQAGTPAPLTGDPVQRLLAQNNVASAEPTPDAGLTARTALSPAEQSPAGLGLNQVAGPAAPVAPPLVAGPEGLARSMPAVPVQPAAAGAAPAQSASRRVTPAELGPLASPSAPAQAGVGAVPVQTAPGRQASGQQGPGQLPVARPLAQLTARLANPVQTNVVTPPAHPLAAPGLAGGPGAPDPTAEQLLRQASSPTVGRPLHSAAAAPAPIQPDEPLAGRASAPVERLASGPAGLPGPDERAGPWPAGRVPEEADARPKDGGAGGAVNPSGVAGQADWLQGRSVQGPGQAPGSAYGRPPGPVPRPLGELPTPQAAVSYLPTPTPTLPNVHPPSWPAAALPGGVRPSVGQPAQALPPPPPPSPMGLGQSSAPLGRPAPVQVPAPQAAAGPASRAAPAQPLAVQSLAAQPLAAQTAAAQKLERALADPAVREPLPLSARAQLAPLLGQDLPDVRLVRGALAAEATAAAAADALAVGDTVLLSPGQDLSSPRALALLAHELTHVLRARDPGFVPAIARLAASGNAPGRPRPPVHSGVPAAHLDEEVLAEQVEGQVRAQMERRPAAGSPTPARQRAPAGPAGARPSPDLWGGLPAPWEPMPHWDLPAAPAPARAAPAAPSARPSAPSSPAAGAAVARAASTTRSVDSGASTAGAPGADPAKSQGPSVGNDQNKSNRNAPDLDRLAQQVYALLKRRLSNEVRRSH